MVDLFQVVGHIDLMVQERKETFFFPLVIGLRALGEVKEEELAMKKNFLFLYSLPNIGPSINPKRQHFFVTCGKEF